MDLKDFLIWKTLPIHTEIIWNTDKLLSFRITEGSEDFWLSSSFQYLKIIIYKWHKKPQRLILQFDLILKQKHAHKYHIKSWSNSPQF